MCAHLDDDDLIQLGIINTEHRQDVAPTVVFLSLLRGSSFRKILISNANLWKYQLNPEDINTQEVS